MSSQMSPDLPPHRSSLATRALIDVAARGAFQLPRCTNCDRFSWPMHEVCPHCLSDLQLADAPNTARLLSKTEVLAPATPYFRSEQPWQIGLVLLAGETPALAFIHPASRVSEDLSVSLLLDRAGQAVLYAAPDTADLMADTNRKELGMFPENQTVLITDASHPATPALVPMLRELGVKKLYGGLKEGSPHFDIAGLEILPLNVQDSASVHACAELIGDDLGLVINTVDAAQRETTKGLNTFGEILDTVAAGLHRLADAFLPRMQARAGQTDAPCGWVNIGSIHALASPPQAAEYGAAHAAALSLCRSLRAEYIPSGLRVMTVLCGPFAGSEMAAPGTPVLRPQTLARCLANALRDGREDVVVGDYAQELESQIKLSPKAVERTLTNWTAP